MRWITHQTGAILGGLALGLPMPAIALAGIGAVLPDVIDQKLSAASGKRRRQKVFNKIHRGASHWFGWWLAAFLLALASNLPVFAHELAFGFAFGSLSHVGLDLLTPRGVPLLPFRNSFRLSLPVCSTGSAGEYLFLAAMAGAGLFAFQDELKPLLAACF